MINLKSVTHFTLLVVLFFGCRTQSSKGIIVFEEKEHGIAKVTSSKFSKSKESPSGKIAHYSGFEIIKKTDTVIGKTGLIFGITFEIHSEQYKFLKVESVWSFPKAIIDGSGKSFKEIRKVGDLKTNIPQWMAYIIIKDSEIVKGNWTLQYYYRGYRNL